jgi:hypothetical protein
MRFWRHSILAFSLTIAAGASAAPAAPRYFYSPWLSPQLFGLLPAWPSSAEDAAAGIARAQAYEAKSQASFNRADADLQMNIAAANAAGSQEDDSPEDQKAWHGLADRHDFNDADNDKIEALQKKMTEIDQHYQGQVEVLDHAALIKWRDTRPTCAQSFQTSRETVTQEYTIAQQQNEALKGLWEEMRGVVQQIIRREERWATAYAPLHPLHKLAYFDQMHMLQGEAMSGTHMLSQQMQNELRSQILPRVDAKQRMDADKRTCN